MHLTVFMNHENRKTPADSGSMTQQMPGNDHGTRASTGPVKISLVIPAYNEEKYITPTLRSVARAKQKFENATGERAEVIVVDNASTDRTAEIARSFGCTVVPFAKHQISAVRNAGARHARGEYLAFVDADRSVLHEDTFLEIDRNLSSPRIYGGGVRFEPEKWSVVILVFLTAFRIFCWALGLGFVLYYLRRRDFEALGGWDERMYAAEDADMSFRMKRAAGVSGRKLRTLRSRLTFCTRKVDMLPLLPTAWHTLRILVRWGFHRKEAVRRFLYDVDRLR